jgi:hypothetical protein
MATMERNSTSSPGAKPTEGSEYFTKRLVFENGQTAKASGASSTGSWQSDRRGSTIMALSGVNFEGLRRVSEEAAGAQGESYSTVGLHSIDKLW